MKPGPVSKYSPDMCDKIKSAAAEGKHIAGMMCEIGISSNETWYRWQKEHPEFGKAVKEADIISLAFYEENLLRGALGEIPGFNATAMATIMNNKFRKEYSRSGTGGTEITFNTLNLSDSEKMQKITQKLERLKSLGVDIEGQYTSEPD